jgi:acyl carrier protein
MSDLISETILDIVSKKLNIRISESLESEIINKNRAVFSGIIDEIEEELKLFIGDGLLEDIETVADLIGVCEQLEADKTEQKKKNG